MNGAKGYGLKTQPPVWFTLQLELSGYAERIDCRSYEERGIDKGPQQHLGPAAHAMQERGITLDILRPDPEVERQKWELRKEEGKLWKELVWVKAELVEAREKARIEEAAELAQKREQEWKAREAEEKRIRKEQRREYARAHREEVKARQEGEEKGKEETRIEAPVKEDNFWELVMPENDEEIAQRLGPPERTVEPEPPRILSRYEQAQLDPAYCRREFEVARHAVEQLEANCLSEVNERIQKEQKDHLALWQESVDAESEARVEKESAKTEYENCNLAQRFFYGPGIEKRIKEGERQELGNRKDAENRRHQLDLVLNPEKIKKEAHELALDRDTGLHEHFKKLREIQMGHVREADRERHLGHDVANELDRGGIEGPGDGQKRGRELGRDRGIEL